tara:strand:- start:808 stop:1101 length:294 start_codon:yes stop_codon:yes gene_type:complete
MTIKKEVQIGKIEIVSGWNVQVATDTIIKEDDIEISRTRHRHVIVPFTSMQDKDEKWTHTDTDISKEDAKVQAVCNAIWTDAVKAEYKTFTEAQATL